MSMDRDEQALRASRDPLAALALADLLEEQGCDPGVLEQHRWRARVMVDLLPALVVTAARPAHREDLVCVDGVEAKLRRTTHCIRVIVRMWALVGHGQKWPHTHPRDFLPTVWQFKFLYNERKPRMVDYEACNSNTWKWIRGQVWRIADAMLALKVST